MIPTKTEIELRISLLKAERSKLESNLEVALAECRKIRELITMTEEKLNSQWATYNKFYTRTAKILSTS